MDSLQKLGKKIGCDLLQTNDFSSLQAIISEYQGYDWEEFIRPKSKLYVRSKVYQDVLHDIYIITWPPGQSAPIHDHAAHGCWLRVLQGEIHETIYNNKFEPIREQQLQVGKIGFMHNDIGLHSIDNTSDKIAVTLHVYSPPCYKANYYQPTAYQPTANQPTARQ